MSNPEKNYKGCGVVILALFILSLVTNMWLIKRGQAEPEPQVVIEHDTLWRDTTINKPVAADSTKTGEIVYIKVPYPVPSGCQGTGTWQDSATYQSPGISEVNPKRENPRKVNVKPNKNDKNEEIYQFRSLLPVGSRNHRWHRLRTLRKCIPHRSRRRCTQHHVISHSQKTL